MGLPTAGDPRSTRMRNLESMVNQSLARSLISATPIGIYKERCITLCMCLGPKKSVEIWYEFYRNTACVKSSGTNHAVALIANCPRDLCQTQVAEW